MPTTIKLSVCMWCGEEAAPAFLRSVGGAAWHRECLLRAMVGSVGHLEGRCSCFGGSDHDPPGMTRREAALAAAALAGKRNIGEIEYPACSPYTWLEQIRTLNRGES